MKKSRVIVTDHAVVRYLERGLGVDMEGLRRRIGKRADIALTHGASTVTIDGLTFCLRDGYVTTILESRARKSRRAKRRRIKK